MFTLSQPVGEERNYNHESCGDLRGRLYIKRIYEGWLYHCHNCNWSGFKRSKDSVSIEETRRRLNERGLKVSSSLYNARNHSLPLDCSYDLPPSGRIWLGRYDITEDEIKRYRFGFSEKLNRLILPLYNREGELVYWQGRNCGKVTKDNPKYLNVRSSKDNIVVFNSTRADNNSICIVEDILSAIKVSRYIHALPLLGSYVSTKVIQAVKDYDEILLFLDYDKRFTSLKASSRIRLFTGKPCRSIIDKCDPKELNDEQLKEILYGT